MVWVLRCAVLAAGALSCSLALLVSSVYTLFVLCGDLVYVLLFPQLCCVLYFPKVNSYGLLAGLSVGLTGRLLIGEQAIHLNPVRLLIFYSLIAYSGFHVFKSMFKSCFSYWRQL